MSRIHSTLIALLIGATATAGLAAAARTVPLGQKAAAPSVSAKDLAARKAKLAAWRRSLHDTLAKHPPKLPKLPHFAPVASVQVAAATPVTAQAPQPHVTYVRPKTVVKYEHAPATTTTTTTTSWSDDGSGDDGSGDDGGDGGGD